jgi:amidase
MTLRTRTRALAGLAAAVPLLSLAPLFGAGPQPPAAPAFRVEEATIADIRAALGAGTLTCHQLVTSYLDRIRAYEDGGPKLNAITTVNPKAIDAAIALDAGRRRSGRMGPLHCIPVLLKDNIDTVDMPTSNGSVILKDARAPDDARIVKALKAQEALILGKASMGEFAGGSYNTIDGQTLNPYNFKRATGGSSSGSASAVSANLAVLAIGTDTSTSVRGPAAFTGIVGLRPTTGLVSRDGIAPKNLTFDTAGPLARTVTDTALLLNAIAGPDPADPLSVDVFSRHAAPSRAGERYADFTQFLQKDALKGARLGVIEDFFGGDPEIDALARTALARMKALGAELVSVRLDPAFLDFYVRNGNANIRRIADYRFKKDWEAYLATLGPAVPKTTAEFIRIYETTVAKSKLPVEASVVDLLKRAVATSTNDPAYQHLITKLLPEATKVKLGLYERYKVDALVFPYQPSFAPPIANPLGSVEDPAFVAARERPQPATFATYGSVGFPAVVVPMGFGTQGLPTAISFMGRPYEDGRILGYAYAYEQATVMRRPSPLLPHLGPPGSR